jgi:hypothetical protein
MQCKILGVALLFFACASTPLLRQQTMTKYDKHCTYVQEGESGAETMRKHVGHKLKMRCCGEDNDDNHVFGLMITNIERVDGAVCAQVSFDTAIVQCKVQLRTCEGHPRDYARNLTPR